MCGAEGDSARRGGVYGSSRQQHHAGNRRGNERGYITSATHDIVIPGFSPSMGPGINILMGTPISGSSRNNMANGTISQDQYMDEELMDASTLHKYSAGMRDRDFSYINNEEEPLVVDALFNYTLSSPYEKL